MESTPTVEALFRHFPDSHDLPEVEPIIPEEMPEPYRSLLVHPEHMTVTVEEYYCSRVEVEVIDAIVKENTYARKILLRTITTHQVVQYGIVEINLQVLNDVVRHQILEGKIPLGRVLIEQNVLRKIIPVGYLQVTLPQIMRDWFHTAASSSYGRLGVIYTDHRPAIEVLEILAPIPSGK